MLTRLYVDNFRCLENFEYCPERRQLIFGENGTGKSTMFDALLILRQIAIAGTRWLSTAERTHAVAQPS